MSLTRRTKRTLRLIVAIAALALLIATRRTQVLLIYNDSPTLELSATVALADEVRELGTVPPGAVGYVWFNTLHHEAEFKIDARWSDGKVSKLDACYVPEWIPQLYSVHPTPTDGELRCYLYLPAPMGIGIPYAAIRSFASRL